MEGHGIVGWAELRIFLEFWTSTYKRGLDAFHSKPKHLLSCTIQNPEQPDYLLECILRKNVFDKRWVSIFSTLTKFEQHLCLQIDEMSNFTCYLQSLVPGKVYMQNMYITIHK